MSGEECETLDIVQDDIIERVEVGWVYDPADDPDPSQCFGEALRVKFSGKPNSRTVRIGRGFDVKLCWDSEETAFVAFWAPYDPAFGLTREAAVRSYLEQIAASQRLRAIETEQCEAALKMLKNGVVQ